MGCAVTFHDRVERDQLEAAVEPMAADQMHRLLEDAPGEAIHVALGKEDVEVELTLCGDAEMTRLNFDHMGERGPTDVLAFPLHEWEIEGHRSRLGDDDGSRPPGALLLGDVVVDVDQAVRQASVAGSRRRKTEARSAANSRTSGIPKTSTTSSAETLPDGPVPVIR